MSVAFCSNDKSPLSSEDPLGGKEVLLLAMAGLQGRGFFFVHQTHTNTRSRGYGAGITVASSVCIHVT